ncbi:MAG: hypothetical protein IPQ12_07370 [Polaromonas sp.]|nr:hypothetical protein [Polaromonas sp.]
MKQTFDSTNIDDLNSIIARDCWSIQLLASYLEKQGIVRLYSPLELTIGIVGWLNQLAHVGQSPRKRKYTRLQLVENLLSLLGLQLTQRDFEPWIIAESDLAPNGFWRPNQLLPYAPEDIRIELYQNSINELEHKLHQTQIALNRTHAELDFVTAERKHFFAVAIENIRKLVKQDFENSTSWRITKPLRTFSALLKGNTSQDQIDARESFPTDPLTWDSVIPPWEKPGYSTEVAWRAESQGKFDRHDYVEWVKRYDTLDTLALDQLRKEALTLSQSHDAVTFSLLMIVDECPLEGFQQAVNSIQNQLYPNWELCIAIKNNADESVIQFIGSLAAHDCRIKFLQSDNTRSNLLNEALSLATGTWITHLRAANMIASQALLAMTKALISHTFCDIIYSDSDNYLLPSRSRTEPDLKPDWNLDLFYANNYIQDLCFYKSSLVHSCCGFDARIRNVNAAFRFNFASA